MGRWRWIAAGIAVVVTGCSGSGPEEDVLAGDYLTAADVSRITSAATGPQRAALGDGRVSYDEYRKATYDTVKCIRSARPPAGDIGVIGPRARRLGSGGDDPRFLDYEIEIVADPAGEAETAALGERMSKAVETISQRCRDRHLTDIDRVWVYQHVLTPEKRAEQRKAMAECLRAADVPIDRDAGDRKIFEAVGENGDQKDVAVCRDRYRDLFLLGSQ